MSDLNAVLRVDSDRLNVYLGFWTNWSHGKIQGATLTLSRQNGGLLTAFLVVYISSSGKSFWRISCFFLHWLLSSTKSQDGLYHQRQAILRNTGTATDAAIKLFGIVYAWRRKTKNLLRRVLPTMILAIMASSAFAVASIFSSRVTTSTANEVLLDGHNCGYLNLTPTSENIGQYITLMDPYYSERITSFLNNALQCYSNTADSSNCNLYVKPRLPFTVQNASCPFRDNLCRTDINNLFLDTGYLDSHREFGFNAPESSRFLYRRVQQCAPLVTGGYSAPYNNTKSPQIPLTRYYYGPAIIPGDLKPREFTYQVPANLTFYNYDDCASNICPTPDYSLSILSAIAPSLDAAQSNHSTWAPIPSLGQADADVILIILTAPGIAFEEPCDDLWYSAHKPYGTSSTTNVNNTLKDYTFDEPASVLACTLQEQFCNPNLPEPTRCEPLRGIIQTPADGSDPLRKLWQGAGKSVTSLILGARDMLQVSVTAVTTDIIRTGGISALTSRYGLRQGLQGPLPDFQWQADVTHWFAASLSSYQAAFVDMALGPPSKEFNQFVGRMDNRAAQSLCHNQKILSTQYSSFNVLGIVIILVIGGTFMVLDLCLETLVDLFQKRQRKTTENARYARLEWKSTSTLQLQRLAHEQLPTGTWTNTLDSVPVTKRGELLGVLDITDREHPRLRLPDVEGDVESVGQGSPIEQASGNNSEDNSAVGMESVAPAGGLDQTSSGNTNPTSSNPTDPTNHYSSPPSSEQDALGAIEEDSQDPTSAMRLLNPILPPSAHNTFVGDKDLEHPQQRL